MATPSVDVGTSGAATPSTPLGASSSSAPSTDSADAPNSPPAAHAGGGRRKKPSATADDADSDTFGGAFDPFAGLVSPSAAGGGAAAPMLGSDTNSHNGGGGGGRNHAQSNGVSHDDHTPESDDHRTASSSSNRHSFHSSRANGTSSAPSADSDSHAAGSASQSSQNVPDSDDAKSSSRPTSPATASSVAAADIQPPPRSSSRNSRRSSSRSSSAASSTASTPTTSMKRSSRKKKDKRTSSRRSRREARADGDELKSESPTPSSSASASSSVPNGSPSSPNLRPASDWGGFDDDFGEDFGDAKFDDFPTPAPVSAASNHSSTAAAAATSPALEHPNPTSAELLSADTADRDTGTGDEAQNGAADEPSPDGDRHQTEPQLDSVAPVDDEEASASEAAAASSDTSAPQARVPESDSSSSPTTLTDAEGASDANTNNNVAASLEAPPSLFNGTESSSSADEASSPSPVPAASSLSRDDGEDGGANGEHKDADGELGGDAGGGDALLMPKPSGGVGGCVVLERVRGSDEDDDLTDPTFGVASASPIDISHLIKDNKAKDMTISSLKEKNAELVAIVEALQQQVASANETFREKASQFKAVKKQEVAKLHQQFKQISEKQRQKFTQSQNRLRSAIAKGKSIEAELMESRKVVARQETVIKAREQHIASLKSETALLKEHIDKMKDSKEKEETTTSQIQSERNDLQEKLAALAQQHELANQSISAIQLKEDALREMKCTLESSTGAVYNQSKLSARTYYKGQYDVRWYRSFNASYHRIAGATKTSYTCNANDIGSVIKVELISRDVADCKVTAEIGPVKVEAAIGEQVKKYLAKLEAEFEVTSAPPNKGTKFILMNKKNIKLREGRKTKLKDSWNKSMRITLFADDSRRFSLRLNDKGLDLGYLAKDSKTRDVIALVLRSMSAKILMSESEYFLNFLVFASKDLTSSSDDTKDVGDDLDSFDVGGQRRLRRSNSFSNMSNTSSLHSIDDKSLDSLPARSSMGSLVSATSAATEYGALSAVSAADGASSGGALHRMQSHPVHSKPSTLSRSSNGRKSPAHGGSISKSSASKKLALPTPGATPTGEGDTTSPSTSTKRSLFGKLRRKSMSKSTNASTTKSGKEPEVKRDKDGFIITEEQRQKPLYEIDDDSSSDDGEGGMTMTMSTLDGAGGSGGDAAGSGSGSPALSKVEFSSTSADTDSDDDDRHRPVALKPIRLSTKAVVAEVSAADLKAKADLFKKPPPSRSGKSRRKMQSPATSKRSHRKRGKSNSGVGVLQRATTMTHAPSSALASPQTRKRIGSAAAPSTISASVARQQSPSPAAAVAEAKASHHEEVGAEEKSKSKSKSTIESKESEEAPKDAEEAADASSHSSTKPPFPPNIVKPTSPQLGPRSDGNAALVLSKPRGASPTTGSGSGSGGGAQPLPKAFSTLSPTTKGKHKRPSHGSAGTLGIGLANSPLSPKFTPSRARPNSIEKSHRRSVGSSDLSERERERDIAGSATANLMELVSARMNAGVVQEYSVVGELSVTLNPPPVTDSQIVLKIANADTLSKVVRNPKCVTPGDSPGEYVALLPAGQQQVTILKYRVLTLRGSAGNHTDADLKPPLLAIPRWTFTGHADDEGRRQEGEEQSHAEAVLDIEYTNHIEQEMTRTKFLAAFEIPEGEAPHVKALISSSPKAKWSPKLQKLLWHMPNLNQDHGHLMAKFSTTGTMKPEPKAVQVSFVLNNALISQVDITKAAEVGGGASDSKSLPQYRLREVRKVIKTDSFIVQ